MDAMDDNAVVKTVAFGTLPASVRASISKGRRRYRSGAPRLRLTSNTLVEFYAYRPGNGVCFRVLGGIAGLYFDRHPGFEDLFAEAARG